MTDDLKLLSMMTDQEFRGHTFNGQSLMETLRQLSASEAVDRNTVEGYSAWDNLVHCVYFKYVVVRQLGASAPCDPYPWKEESFPPVPDASEEAWKRALDYAELVHDTYLAALKTLDPARLGEPFPAWKCTLGEALIWIPPHDTYHVAQVRNMGLARFRKPRKPITEGF
jgi:uncharacterized damage-inducible protein DinB